MAGEVKASGNEELTQVLEQIPEGVLIVDQDAVIQFANRQGARLVKLKPKVAVGSTFAHDIEDGTMRDFDVEMTVKSITWAGEPAQLLHLKSLKSSGAFHLEWKLEAALERAREAEEALEELKNKSEPAAAPSGTTDNSFYEEKISELEALLELAEQRADELQSDIALDDHQRATELTDAISCAREAEEQVRDLEAELSESRERIRVAEEQAEVAEERAYSLEAELEQLLAEREESEQPDQGEGTEELQQRVEQLESQLKETAATRDELQRRLEELEEEVSRATATAAESEQKAQEQVLETEELKKRLEEVQREAQEQVGDASAQEEALAEKQQLIDSLEEEVKQLREQGQLSAEEAEELAEQLRLELEKFEGAKQEYDDKLSSLSAELEAAAEERDSLLHELEEAARATEEVSVEAQELQQKMQSMESLSSELEQHKKEIRRLTTLLEDAEELAQKGEKVEKLERKLEGALRRSEEAEERLHEERRLLNELKEKLEKVTSESRESLTGESGHPETERLAFQDELTGLPNRNIIQRYLGFMLKQSARYGRLTAMLRIDCDNFGAIGDTFGVEIGNQLLRAVGERLSSVVRGSDVLGRFAEDEFIMLLSEMADQDEASVITAAVIKRIYQKMKKPFEIEGQSITLGVSIGVTLYPLDAKNGEQMFEHASVALKRAKDTGRGMAQYFTPELQNVHVARNELDQELKQALEEKQFEVLYQPIFDLSNGQVVGVEALVRWNHPVHGMLSPKHFLQVAEESGIIVLIGNWALREALSNAAKWHEAGLGIFVSVNLCRRQLLQADLLPTVQAALTEVRCSPERLLLEVSEHLTGSELPKVSETLKEFQKIGVRLAIDNFGTAASSLTEIRKGPFQVLKVDRSFVSGIPASDEHKAIVLSALTVGHHLGRISIAVGVETQQQKDWLIKTGCRFAQGNGLCEPLKTQQLLEFFKR